MMRIERSEIRVISVGGMEVCLRGVGEVCRVVEEVFGRCVVGVWGRCWGCVSGVLGRCVWGCPGGVSGGVGEVCWGWDDVEKCEDGSRPATRSALSSGYLGKSGHLPRSKKRQQR